MADLREAVERLLALSEKATSGPWKQGGDGPNACCLSGEIIAFTAPAGGYQYANTVLVPAFRNLAPPLLRLLLSLLEEREHREKFGMRTLAQQQACDFAIRAAESAMKEKP